MSFSKSFQTLLPVLGHTLPVGKRKVLPKFDWVYGEATMLSQPGITEAKFDWVLGEATLLYKV